MVDETIDALVNGEVAQCLKYKAHEMADETDPFQCAIAQDLASSTKPMRWLMKRRAFKHLPILRFLHLLREPFAQEVAAS